MVGFLPKNLLETPLAGSAAANEGKSAAQKRKADSDLQMAMQTVERHKLRALGAWSFSLTLFSGKGSEVACIKFQIASGANPGKIWLYRRNIGGTTAMWEHVAGFKGGCQHVLGRKQWKKWHRPAAIVSRRWFTGFVAPGVLGCQNMVQCM